MNTKISITFLSVIIAIFAFTLLFPGQVYARVVCYWNGEDCSLGCARMCTAQSAGCCECNRRWVCIYYISIRFSVENVEDLLSDSGVSEMGIREITEALGVGIEEEKLKAILSEHVEGDAQVVLEEIVKLAESENPIELPKPGLTPSSPFYFLERWTEAVGEFFAFSPEARARLQVKRAYERLAEVQAMLAEKEVNATGIDIALNRLQTHAAKAASIVERERNSGKDVSALAKELKAAFRTQKMFFESMVVETREGEIEVIEVEDGDDTTIRNKPGRIILRQKKLGTAFERAEEKFEQALQPPSSRSLPSAICQSGWHEFLAGVDDQFALPTEPAIPSAGLQLLMNQYQGQSHRDFDELGKNRVLGHTFTGVAPNPALGIIEEASLELRIKPTPRTGNTYAGSQGIPSTDSISILFFDDSGSTLATGWSRRFGLDIVTNVPGLFPGQWLKTHPAEFLQLDLDTLPNSDGSTSSLIQSLNTHDLLDVYVQDDTVVDYLKLRVRHSCLPPIEITEPSEPFCREDLWKCGGWSACTPAGTQTRPCKLVTDCPGIRTPKPAEEQTCKMPQIGVEPSREPLCTEDIWNCGRWGECSTAGAQTRTCTLKQDCPFVSTPKPAESQTCAPPPPSCTVANQPCGGGLPSCCEGLACTPSFGAYGVCQAAPSPSPSPEPPDLQAKKFFNSALHFGSSGSFTISVGNIGSGPAASPITVTDVLPDGLTYLSFSDPYSNDWSCSASGQKVTCVYNGPDVSPGGSLPTLIINVAIASTAEFPAAGDQIANCATVEHPGDKNPDNNQSCVTAIITSR